MALLAGAVCMRCASVFFASNSLWGGGTAPHCDRGSLRMANQEVTDADNAFAHGTGAGSRSHLGAGTRLSRTAKAREVARTWPTRRHRARFSRTAWAREVARTAAAVAQKWSAVSVPHCDKMYPASFGLTRRGSASKGKGIAAACAVEKERDSDQAQMLQRDAAPRPKESSKQKRRLEK